MSKNDKVYKIIFKSFRVDEYKYKGDFIKSVLGLYLEGYLFYAKNYTEEDERTPLQLNRTNYGLNNTGINKLREDLDKYCEKAETPTLIQI